MTDLEKAARMALEALGYYEVAGLATTRVAKSITALRQALEQPAQQEPWADKCRIDLVTAIHFLASDFENALGAFGGDTEARRKAEGGIAHARIVASRWNWNGTTEPAQQEPVDWEAVAADQAMTIAMMKVERKPWVGLTQQDIDIVFDDTQEGGGFDDFARAIEAKLKEKNA